MMNNPLLLILLALILVIFVNLLLIASVQNQARNTKGGTIRKMLRSIREPFQEGNSELDELADLVDQLDQDLKAKEHTEES